MVTLRSLCDVAKRKRFKLFVTFVDFSQAYDRVQQDVLFSVLEISVQCDDVVSFGCCV